MFEILQILLYKLYKLTCHQLKEDDTVSYRHVQPIFSLPVLNPIHVHLCFVLFQKLNHSGLCRKISAIYFDRKYISARNTIFSKKKKKKGSMDTSPSPRSMLVDQALWTDPLA